MANLVSNPLPASALEADEVRRELDRVLNSPSFRGSKRCHDFLQYVVVKAIEGDAKNLKERSLAIEVFGRTETEDLSDVSVVRVGAREVRKRLAQYYIGEGSSNELRIDLPSGSYVPAFQHRGTLQANTTVHVDDGIPLTPTPAEPKPLSAGSNQPRYFLYAGMAVTVCAAILGGGYFLAAQTPFNLFWGPVFSEKQPIELLMAHPIAYHPSSRASQLDRQINGVSATPVQRPIQVPPEMLNGSDFVPVQGQYVGFGDAVAAVRLTTLFAQRHVNAKVRLASRVEFSDLVGSGVVLIGSFTNRWTGELTRDLRYQFVWRDGKPIIQDMRSEKNWILGGKRDSGESNEDYILLSRLPHSKTNGFVVVCAGLNYYGTEEAGRILAEPDLLNPILKKLPDGWAYRNLQLVLHVEVIGEAPALPEVVAVNSW